VGGNRTLIIKKIVKIVLIFKALMVGDTNYEKQCISSCNVQKIAIDSTLDKTHKWLFDVPMNLSTNVTYPSILESN
jgi:hypothetical protein